VEHFPSSVSVQMPVMTISALTRAAMVAPGAERDTIVAHANKLAAGRRQ
jgi:hypothetical protein